MQPANSYYLHHLNTANNIGIVTTPNLVNNRVSLINGTAAVKRSPHLSNCYSCSRSLNPSQPTMVLHEHTYHRDCFKCCKCDKYLNENEANNLVEQKHLYCRNCFIKRKPLQSMIASINATSNNFIPTPSNATIAALGAFSTTNSILNDLKLKFEPSLGPNTKGNFKSNLNAHSTDTVAQVQQQSFSSSSSSSNFSLSPSSSSSWSSTNSSTSSNTAAVANSLMSLNMNQLNCTSQINQRITMLNNLAARQTNSNHFNEPTLNSHKSNQLESIKIASKREPVVTKTELSSEKTINKTTNLTSYLASLNRPDDLNKVSPNSSLTNLKANVHSGWIPLKLHTPKCNLIMRKTKRKRSKSLPTKFNVDSLLDYLNCSMILNKYELKKLHQQRNMLMNSSSNSGAGSAVSVNLKSRHRQLLNSNYYPHSSGYNSENHSNSSNSNYQPAGAMSTNILNFYRLSISHLPLHFNNAPQCTCGASNINNSCISSVGSNDASLLGPGRRTSTSKPLSSSPNLKSQINDEEDDDEDDEDEDEEDDELDEELDDDEVEEEEEPDEHRILNQSLDMSANRTSTTMYNDSIKLDKNSSGATKEQQPKKSDSMDFKFSQLGVSGLHRAAGTSHCQHTARIDLRRVRSTRDLTQVQQIYSANDFVFKEKLGEGFFANVKKIISKETNKEMVLKELKLSCIETSQSSAAASAGLKHSAGSSLSSSTNGDCIDSNENLYQQARVDFLVNYAELNAAHKSFLKEAQVLRNLNHPNVIKLMGIMFTKEKHLNLILEYISGGTLKDIIHNISNALPWPLRVGYAKDIAAAMQYLHSLNIIHRDLKSDNCLVKDNGRTVVVADFGLSRIINNGNENTACKSFTNRNNLTDLLQNDSMSASIKLHNSLTHQYSPQSSSATNSFIVAAKRKLKRHHQPQRKQRYAVVGNSFSMAPEMLKHQIYDERVDIFSFGIICCEIIGRVQADPDYLPRTSDFGLNVELFRKKYCEADCPKHFIKIAIACCELEPEKRPPFARTHLWLETILSHLETNNPIPKNLLKNILDQNTKRPISALVFADTNKELKN